MYCSPKESFYSVWIRAAASLWRQLAQNRADGEDPWRTTLVEKKLPGVWIVCVWSGKSIKGSDSDHTGPPRINYLWKNWIVRKCKDGCKVCKYGMGTWPWRRQPTAQTASSRRASRPSKIFTVIVVIAASKVLHLHRFIFMTEFFLKSILLSYRDHCVTNIETSKKCCSLLCLLSCNENCVI